MMMQGNIVDQCMRNVVLIGRIKAHDKIKHSRRPTLLTMFPVLLLWTK